MEWVVNSGSGEKTDLICFGGGTNGTRWIGYGGQREEREVEVALLQHTDGYRPNSSRIFFPGCSHSPSVLTQVSFSMNS